MLVLQLSIGVLIVGVLSVTKADPFNSEKTDPNIKMMKKLLSMHSCYSPLILDSILTQLALATKLCSKSFDELKSLLPNNFWFENGVNFKKFKNNHTFPQMKINTGFFLKDFNSTNEKYKNFITTYYETEIHDLNRQWSQDHLKQFYNEIPPIDFLMLSLVKFSGNWMFETSKNASFQLFNGNNIEMTYAVQTNKFLYHFDDSLKILQLNFDNKYDILFLLPNDRDLQKLIDQLSENNIREWKEKLIESNIEVLLPSLYSRSYIILGNFLQSLGIEHLFKDKTKLGYIKLNSEINMLTQISVTLNSNKEYTNTSPGIKRFFANSPFLYLIFEQNTFNIIFAGNFDGDILQL